MFFSFPLSPCFLHSLLFFVSRFCFIYFIPFSFSYFFSSFCSRATRICWFPACGSINYVCCSMGSLGGCQRLSNCPACRGPWRPPSLGVALDTYSFRSHGSPCTPILFAFHYRVRRDGRMCAGGSMTQAVTPPLWTGLHRTALQRGIPWWISDAKSWSYPIAQLFPIAFDAIETIKALYILASQASFVRPWNCRKDTHHTQSVNQGQGTSGGFVCTARYPFSQHHLCGMDYIWLLLTPKDTYIYLFQ